MSDDGSRVVSFRIHPQKDKTAYDTLMELQQDTGLNTREIFTDLLNRYAGVQPEMYRERARPTTLESVRAIVNDELTEFGKDFLTELLQHMQDRVIEDVRSGRVNPDDDNPFGNDGERTAYTQNVMNAWKARQNE